MSSLKVQHAVRGGVTDTEEGSITWKKSRLKLRKIKSTSRKTRPRRRKPQQARGRCDSAAGIGAGPTTKNNTGSGRCSGGQHVEAGAVGSSRLHWKGSVNQSTLEIGRKGSRCDDHGATT